MINYDKGEIKDQLQLEDIYQLLIEFGGEPEYTAFGIISATICHNVPGDGSRKLYYYTNSGLFVCYTGCAEPHFDIFELVRKVSALQWGSPYDLNDAVRWVARRFGISGTSTNGEDTSQLEDWQIFANHEQRHDDIEQAQNKLELAVYDDIILSRFNYSLKIEPWLKEGISQEVLDFARIGFYPGGNQITIPHYDIDGRFIGLRGRTISKEDAEMYGKYRPMRVNKKLYNHPLGYTLYGLNWAKENIKIVKKAIVVEGEKSVLKYMSYFGIENTICVAACGSSLSSYQMQQLLDLGAQEIIIAFDKQYQTLGDEEYKRWVTKLGHITKKYGMNCLISFIFDTGNLLGYKDSPLDATKETFLQLFNTRLDGKGQKYK